MEDKKKQINGNTLQAQAAMCPVKKREESSHLLDLGSLMSAAVGTDAGREQLAKSEFVCLSFTSNSSLKPVRGSRSPLIRTSAMFALLSKRCHLVGPLCDLAANTEKLC